MYADGPRITSGVGASASGGGKYGSLGEDGDDGGESDVCADDDGVWDSEEEEENMKLGGGVGEIGGRHGGNNIVLREVEIVAGTRAIGTWIDGDAAGVRVEYEEHY